MKFLKESFLKFNTYTQIQIGVIGVAFCIFFISVCLLSIISLILINTTYTEIQAMLELKENDQINGVSIYIDSQINIATELSKIYEFHTRAFINNNIRNQDFINNFKPEKYKTYIANFDGSNSTNSDTSSKKQVYQRCFASKQLTPEFENIQKIFAAYLEVIEYTHNTKYYKNNDEPMFKLISFYSNENKCILYFPKIELNEKYSLVNFETFIYSQVLFINMDLDKYIDNYNLNRKKENLATNLSYNPLILGYAAMGANLVEFFKKKYAGQINLITNSLNFQKNFTNSNNTANPNNYFNSISNSFNSKEIKDFLVFEFSDTMVDKLLIKNLIKFPAFKTIVYNRQLLGKTTCGVMQNIHKFYSNQAAAANDTNITLQIDKDCFLFKKSGASRTIFEDYFYPDKESSNYLNVNPELSDNFRRFVKIPVANDSNYPKSIEKSINYKILKFKAADVTTRILINSFFTVWLRPQVYILKSYSLITNNFRIIFTRFLSMQLKIISVNIIISIITGAIVVLLTFRVSKSIGDPINLLISIVKNINPQKEKKKNKKKNLNRCSVLADNNKESKGLSALDNHQAEKDLQKAENKENKENNDDGDGHGDGDDDVSGNNENNLNENTQMKSEATVNNTEIVSKEKNLEKIKFPDDETINKFFNICKKLIKGGLSDENLKVKQMQYNDEAYNNISFMKSNNLIVQEEKILKETESRSDKIFSHKSLIEKIKDYNAEKANNSNNNYKDFFSQASLPDNSNNNLNSNNINSNNHSYSNFSLYLNKLYNPNTPNTNIIVNTKNGDEIKEIKLERQKTFDKPIKNILSSSKHLNSFMTDSPQKPNIFIASENAKSKFETVDLYPKFKEKKSEIDIYFQNTKNVNSLNLSFYNINFLMHSSNIERKKTDNPENYLFNEESEFDKIVGKQFNKESLDRVFEFLKLFSNAN